jgi:hypothetical protein
MGNNPFDKLHPREPIWKDFEMTAEALEGPKEFVEEQDLPETVWEEPPPSIPEMPEVHWEDPHDCEVNRFAIMTVHDALQAAFDRCEVAESQYPVYSEAWEQERGRVHAQRLAEGLELEAVQEPLTAQEGYLADCRNNLRYRNRIRNAEDLLTIADVREYLAARRALERGFLSPEEPAKPPYVPPKRVWGFRQYWGGFWTAFWLITCIVVWAGATLEAGFLGFMGGFVLAAFCLGMWFLTAIYPDKIFGESGGWGTTKGPSGGAV